MKFLNAAINNQRTTQKTIQKTRNRVWSE